MTEAELAHLIGRAQEKDPDAFEALVDLYGRRLHGYLYRLTGSRDDAEDLLQEVFLRVVRTLDSYTHDGRFVGWLFRIATNLARDRVRRLGRAPQIQPLELNGAAGGLRRGELGDSERGTGAPEAPMMLRDDVDALQRALAELPEAEREVVMLRHFSEMSFGEIAEAMGTPLGTALARGHRGLAKLRERMTERV